MSGFLSAHINYILLASGLGFLVLGTVCLLLRTGQDLLPARRWPRLFGLSLHNEHEQLEEKLKRGVREKQAILDNIPDMAWLKDKNGTFMAVNEALAEAWGVTLDHMIGKTDYDFCPRDLAQRYRDDDAEVMASGQRKRVEEPFENSDGETSWIETIKTPILDEAGEVIGTTGIARDITERKRAEMDRRIQSSAINAASDQIIITDKDGCIQFVNPAFEREMGYSSDEAIGKAADILLRSDRHDDAFYAVLRKTILREGTWNGEIYSRCKDGSSYIGDMTITPVMDESQAIEHFVAITRNVTEKKRYEQQLDHLAHHDALTCLPNRLLFGDRLTQSILQAKRHSQTLAVLFLDLDRFKLINDTQGHSQGDLLLKQVAQRLVGTLREVDTVARMSGDEFTIILPDIHSLEDAFNCARRVLDDLEKPFSLDGRDVFITASIGMSIFPADGHDAETLVKNADTAMYHAKEKGGNTYHLYTEALNVAAMQRVNLQNSFRRALEQEEFVLFYQPIVCLKTGETVGTEALVRWMHPEHGLMPPDQFIPLAEETGFILPLTEWVIRTACSQNKIWQESGAPAMTIAVNVSARQFQQTDFAEMVKKALRETGLDPQWLELEMTEGTLVLQPEFAVESLLGLQAMGVRLSIDDFGTGYSSLSYLKRFPVNTVKIDRSFVREITTNPDDAAIAGAVVAMAHNLKLRVTAEGVETLEQLEFLKSLDCDEMQGYFVSKPVPAEEITGKLLQIQESAAERPKAA